VEDLNQRNKYRAAILKALLESRNPDTVWGRLRAQLEKNRGSVGRSEILKRGGYERSLFMNDLARLMVPDPLDLGYRGLADSYGVLEE
jgi:hypothetical protein